MNSSMPLSLGVILPPVLMIVGLLFLVMGLFRAPLSFFIRRFRQGRVKYTHPLIKLRVPLSTINDQQVLFGGLLGGVCSTVLSILLLQNMWLVMAIPFVALICGLWILSFLEARQQKKLSQQLIDAAAQVAAALNSDMTLNAALKHVARSLAQPLATPWNWMIETAGSSVIAPDGSAKFLQLKDTVHAVAVQTTNRTFLRFLEHVEGAADLPQAAARDRLQAASDALYASQLREKSVRSKLAHARGSAITVMFVGVGIALFLYSVMTEQWQRAFSSEWGLLATLFFVAIFMSPLVGIALLSRVPDVDF